MELHSGAGTDLRSIRRNRLFDGCRSLLVQRQPDFEEGLNGPSKKISREGRRRTQVVVSRGATTPGESGMIGQLWAALVCRITRRHCSNVRTSNKELAKEMRAQSRQVEVQTFDLKRQREDLSKTFGGRPR